MESTAKISIHNSTNTASEKKDLTASKQDSAPYKITLSEIEERIFFWKEITTLYYIFKFNPYGASSLPVPEFHKKSIADTLQKATVSDYQYPNCDGEGIPGLKQAVIDHFPEIHKLKNNGLTILPENIRITNGAINGINCLIDALCQTDDEVVIFEPIYPFHMGRIYLRKYITLKSSRMKFNTESNRFEFDYDNFRKILTPKTKVVMITNPQNPTSRVFTKEEFFKLSEILADFPNALVFEDCAYWLYHSDDNQVTNFAVAKPGNFDRTVTFYSAGKMYNVTGLRVGFAVGPEHILKELTRIAPMDMLIPPSFEQLLIKEDLAMANLPEENSLDYYENTRIDVNMRAAMLEKEVKKYNINMIKFEGTYYAILDVSSWREKVDQKYYKDFISGEFRKEFDRAFCRMMILENKAGMIPLSCLYFGEDGPDIFVRVALNRNDDDLKYLFKSFEQVLGDGLKASQA